MLRIFIDFALILINSWLIYLLWHLVYQTDNSIN